MGFWFGRMKDHVLFQSDIITKYQNYINQILKNHWTIFTKIVHLCVKGAQVFISKGPFNSQKGGSYFFPIIYGIIIALCKCVN